MYRTSIKPGEGIQVGDNVRIEILSAAKGSVRIGIEAPKELLITKLVNELQSQQSEHQLEAPVFIPGQL